jgi:hypothetical protein
MWFDVMAVEFSIRVFAGSWTRLVEKPFVLDVWSGRTLSDFILGLNMTDQMANINETIRNMRSVARWLQVVSF